MKHPTTSVSLAEIGDAPATAALKPLELTVVVPTFNEAANVPLLIGRLAKALAGIAWEVVFVDDDSPDGTAAVARRAAALDRRVRIIRRLGRRGLSTACVEGVMSSAAPYFAVMDGDLQHDEAVLATMLQRLKGERLDVVVASRYLEADRTAGLDPWRQSLSHGGGRLARLILNAELTDPMSGYFVMTRAAFDEGVRNLSQQGFKILLDVFASAPRPLRFAEVACRFNPREHGESKLDATVAWEFGVLILDKLIGRFVPVRFVLFAGVGGSGVFVHLATLAALTAAGVDFAFSQATGVVVTMTWNFMLNNTITYRDQRLKGAGFFRGLASFYAIGAVGAVANVGISQLIFDYGRVWWLAGVAGALIGVVWNYTMSSVFTWGRRIQASA
jgi:dolichol-phosphate mannosyltransferase